MVYKFAFNFLHFKIKHSTLLLPEDTLAEPKADAASANALGVVAMPNLNPIALLLLLSVEDNPKLKPDEYHKNNLKKTKKENAFTKFWCS